MSVDIDFLSEEVLKAARLRMPFGKFEGTRLIDLPEPYVVWFKQQGYPKGRLGQQMALIYEIKANGLEKLIRPLLEAAPPSEADNQQHQPSANADEESAAAAPDVTRDDSAPPSGARHNKSKPASDADKDAARSSKAFDAGQSAASSDSDDNVP